jgi:predicted RNase H-related nuclease YkuK (DUF458 family)
MKDYSAALEYIKNSSLTSSIYVGSDSMVKKKSGKIYANYCTVVIIHKDSCHGGKIFYFRDRLEDYGNVRARMLQEAGFAIEVAQNIIDVVGSRTLEVHLDLNADPMHQSNVAVKEAVGWVQGVLGVKARIKPEAFAASYAADHVVRDKPM